MFFSAFSPDLSIIALAKIRQSKGSGCRKSHVIVLTEYSYATGPWTLMHDHESNTSVLFRTTMQCLGPRSLNPVSSAPTFRPPHHVFLTTHPLHFNSFTIDAKPPMARKSASLRGLVPTAARNAFLAMTTADITAVHTTEVRRAFLDGSARTARCTVFHKTTTNWGITRATRKETWSVWTVFFDSTPTVL